MPVQKSCFLDKGGGANHLSYPVASEAEGEGERDRERGMMPVKGGLRRGPARALDKRAARPCRALGSGRNAVASDAKAPPRSARKDALASHVLCARVEHLSRTLASRGERRRERRSWLLSVRAEAAAAAADGDAQDTSFDETPVEEDDGLPDLKKVFPRIKEKDPHKLLGIGSEASYDEVQEARLFLVEEYKGHKMSVEAIDIAHDKIISQNFKDRKQDGIKFVSKGGREVKPRQSEAEDEDAGPLGRFVDKRVAKQALLKTVGVFLTVIVWTVATALDSEPTAQVTVGLIATTFFVQQKRQKKADKEENVFWGSVGTAILATAAGWILGNVFPVVFPVLPEGVSVQAICTIFALIAQWFASTYVK